MNSLKTCLEHITSQWQKATEENFTKHPLAIKFRGELREYVIEIVRKVHPEFLINASVGAGNWANVPWMSILDPEITKTTQDGFYPVYLFKADGTGIYLSLNQGITTPTQRLGKKIANEYSSNLSKHLLEQVPGISAWGQAKVELASSTTLGKSYQKSNIAAKFYPSDGIPSDEILKSDLLELLEYYQAAKVAWLKFQHYTADIATVKNQMVTLPLSKPFILLAGISGTGKTRFVRKQAEKSGSINETYSLVSVRPDWHEPSDLLGYVSRLGNNGPVYVVGAALQFMVKAWKHIVDVTGVYIAKQTTFNRAQLGQITPFWLCLDEMNLAPVEQYFADYLSVIETREWMVDGDEHTYQCEPLLKADVFAALVGEDGYGLNALRKDLALGDDNYDTLWEQFVENGISIPFNLIVAGTVNMDETTHGFSRKVIDRALTIDFGRFFPNVYDDFFIPTSKNKVLGFPVISSARHHDFSDVPADINGQRSIEFLSAVNALLKDSPFELAFRALNELLLSVACFKPKDEQELQAVWDDFLMAKVLPRIEGDEDKLRTKDGGDNVLVQLESLLENQLSTIWHAQRPDLLRTTVDDSVLSIDCHSKAKLAWMRDQLNIKTFTSFWP